jgi:hypothetical protein
MGICNKHVRFMVNGVGVRWKLPQSVEALVPNETVCEPPEKKKKIRYEHI